MFICIFTQAQFQSDRLQLKEAELTFAERKCNVTARWRNYLRELTGEGECQLLWGNSEGRAVGVCVRVWMHYLNSVLKLNGVLSFPLISNTHLKQLCSLWSSV